MINNQLRILQYNINHRKEITLVLLFKDTRVYKFDVIIV